MSPIRDGVLLVAPQGGAPRNSAWYFNLAKTPDIKVTHRGRHMSLYARVANADEKPDLWLLCDQYYAPLRRLPGRHESRHSHLRVRTGDGVRWR